MKYFLIAGEASGDLHGSSLMNALRKIDPQAQFSFLGGDLMQEQAGHAPLIHYRDMAYMGITEVVRHLPSILGFMRRARQAIDSERPDAVVLIDYPSFNLRIARHAHRRGIPVHYFISPKVWVWKEWRVRDICRYVDHMYCILPFEKAWYRDRHNYEVEYVGNPTVAEMAQAEQGFGSIEDFCARHSLPQRPVIALVPGSRLSEVRSNLPLMMQAAALHPDYQPVVAGAPGLDDALYAQVMGDNPLPVLHGCTTEIVHHARVALVTSGTATLETALLGTPQVACFRYNGSKWTYRFYARLLHGKYVTLPNLIADRPVIPELLMHLCTVQSIDEELSALLPDGPRRTAMLQGYDEVRERLTQRDCAWRTATLIVESLGKIIPKS